MEKIIVVCGPTATGKTNLACVLAKHFGGELISADSRQIYRGMDIGTGKDLKSKKTIDSLRLPVTYNNRHFYLVPYDMSGIPLWMCDVVRPDEEFSVAHYHNLTMNIIDSIVKRGNIPIFVGGTGLYIRSIIHPFETAEIRPDIELRKKLKGVSLLVLQNMVRDEASGIWDSLNESDRSNPYRLIRKLEIAHSKKNFLPLEFKKMNYFIIGLTEQNEKLYKRIDARVEKRIKQGLLGEIQELLSKGYDWRLQSFNTLGYKEWRNWFENLGSISESDKNTIIKKWKFDEHAYARRQLTWFKKERNIKWFDIGKSYMRKNIVETVSTWYNTKR